MSKKITSGKKTFSRDTSNDQTTEDASGVYGPVKALGLRQDSAPDGLQAAASQLYPSLRSSHSDSRDDSPSEAGKAQLVMAAGSVSVNKVYQHWADGDAALGTKAEWNNNILSDSKSDYFEGEVVPHVFYYKASNNEPLVNGQSYSFNVTYNYYQANTNSGGFLFMTSPDVDRDPANFAGKATTDDTSFSNGGGTHGGFQTVNANITGVSAVSYTTQGGGTIDGHVTITFVYTGPTTQSGGAEIQYGLMIAAPGAVADQGQGPTQGATAWTGGSLQTTVDVGGKGATSLQLMPSAIIHGEIGGTKFNDIDGNVTDALAYDDFIDQLKLDSVYVLGWSDGGNSAYILAYDRPDKVKKVIVSGANSDTDGYPDGALADMKTWTPETISEEFKEYWLKDFLKLSPNKNNWQKSYMQLKHMWITKEVISDDHLSKIKSKFLIVYGDHDVTKLEHGLHIYRTIKGSQLCILPNTTHFVFAEKPVLISNIIKEFLVK